MTEAVRRVTPEEFDWAAPSRVAGAVRAVIEAAEKADGAAPLDEAALLRLRHDGIAGGVLLVSDDPPVGFALVKQRLAG